MYSLGIFQQTAQLMFGRQTAQFKQLVALLAAVSIVLWSLVALTILVRIAVCHGWYRRRYAEAGRSNQPPI